MNLNCTDITSYSADEPTDDIEILFDKLEYPDSATQMLSQVTPIQAFWLVRHIRQHVAMGRQAMTDEIERELLVRMETPMSLMTVLKS